MTTRNIEISEPWFTYINIGKKKYEGRCYWKNVLNYKIGEFIKTTKKAPFLVKITNIFLFKTFKDALSKLNMEDILLWIKSIEEYENIYRHNCKMGYYDRIIENCLKYFHLYENKH